MDPKKHSNKLGKKKEPKTFEEAVAQDEQLEAFVRGGDVSEEELKIFKKELNSFTEDLTYKIIEEEKRRIAKDYITIGSIVMVTLSIAFAAKVSPLVVVGYAGFIALLLAPIIIK